jgi:hypothetical protein
MRRREFITLVGGVQTIAAIGEAIYGPWWRRHVARALGVHVSTVGRWFQAFRPEPLNFASGGPCSRPRILAIHPTRHATESRQRSNLAP